MSERPTYMWEILNRWDPKEAPQRRRTVKDTLREAYKIYEFTSMKISEVFPETPREENQE